MAGSASDVSLASNASLLLGSNTITSFTEDTTESRIASNLFEQSYKSILSQFKWRFATKQAVLARLVASPQSVYDYQFQLPTDLLYLNHPIDINDFEIYEDKLYTNYKEVEIEYVYNISSDKVPPYFATMFEFYLASKFAIPLTGDIDKASYYDGKYKEALQKARFADSTQRPIQGFVADRYVKSRYGY